MNKFQEEYVRRGDKIRDLWCKLSKAEERLAKAQELCKLLEEFKKADASVDPTQFGIETDYVDALNALLDFDLSRIKGGE